MTEERYRLIINEDNELEYIQDFTNYEDIPIENLENLLNKQERNIEQLTIHNHHLKVNNKRLDRIDRKQFRQIQELNEVIRALKEKCKDYEEIIGIPQDKEICKNQIVDDIAFYCKRYKDYRCLPYCSIEKKCYVSDKTFSEKLEEEKKKMETTETDLRFTIDSITNSILDQQDKDENGGITFYDCTDERIEDLCSLLNRFWLMVQSLEKFNVHLINENNCLQEEFLKRMKEYCNECQLAKTQHEQIQELKATLNKIPDSVKKPWIDDYAEQTVQETEAIGQDVSMCPSVSSLPARARDSDELL